MRCVNLQGTSLNTYSASLLILLILNFSKRIYTRLKKIKTKQSFLGKNIYPRTIKIHLTLLQTLFEKIN
mgnify:CR=1 FL=1